jgi:hypothetical protein
MSTLNSNTITTVSSGNSLLFTTSATERLRISPDGKIGIGTSSPSNLLDVNGTIKSTGLYTGYIGIKNQFPAVELDVNGTIKNTNPAFTVTYATTPRPVEPLEPTPYLVGIKSFQAEPDGFQDMIFDNTFVDRGDCVSQTTGYFTAPVAGYYFFSAHIFFNIHPTLTAAKTGAWYFAKNRVKNHITVQGPYTPTANYISYYTLSGTSIQQLNAGDTINIKYVGSPYAAGYSEWSGFLIG